ncbi:MAG TPA: hypothetical protein VFC24_01415 [Casimicrobiaceae bacterium]|nr:hypothetical protein [Casimicrobiaceae bacterium]
MFVAFGAPFAVAACCAMAAVRVAGLLALLLLVVGAAALDVFVLVSCVGTALTCLGLLLTTFDDDFGFVVAAGCIACPRATIFRVADFVSFFALVALFAFGALALPDGFVFLAAGFAGLRTGFLPAREGDLAGALRAGFPSFMAMAILESWGFSVSSWGRPGKPQIITFA